MSILLVMLVIFVVAGGYVAYTSRSRREELEGRRHKELDPLAETVNGGDALYWKLKPGDLVKQIGGPDFLVRRSVSLNENGYRWNEHLLDDAQGTKRWLSVEDDNGLDLGLWQTIVIGDIDQGEPGDKTVTAQGRTFKLGESGGATYSQVAPDGQPTFGEMSYFQYKADDGKMMALQNYGGSTWEASLGDQVSGSDFEIYPSSDPNPTDNR